MHAATVAGRLPDLVSLRHWSLSLAALDAILSPEWEYRYYSFDPQWSDDETMASMRNGSGDAYSIVFSGTGAYIRGFDHESSLSPWGRSPRSVVPGFVDDVPPALRHNISEPAFSFDDVPDITVCMWRLASDDRWSYGQPVDPALRGEDDGADWMFAELDGTAESYATFALDYFEVELRLEDIEAVMSRQPLDANLLRRLNPAVDVAAATDELREMGYS